MESPAAKAAICIVPIALLVAVLLAQTISAEIASIDARNAIELPAKRHQDPQIVITASVKGAKAAGSELRLPRTVVPRFYDVTLLPILEEGNFTTSGRVDILIDCLESTNNITLHAVDIAIDFSSISVLMSPSDQLRLEILGVYSNYLIFSHLIIKSMEKWDIVGIWKSILKLMAFSLIIFLHQAVY